MESGRDKDMKRKITVFALNAMLFALSFSAEAQQANIPRLGFLRSVAMCPAWRYSWTHFDTS